MNTLRFVCPECVKTIKYPSSKSGKRARCPGCKQPIVLPEVDANRAENETVQSKPDNLRPPIKAQVPAGKPEPAIQQPPENTLDHRTLFTELVASAIQPKLANDPLFAVSIFVIGASLVGLAALILIYVEGKLGFEGFLGILALLLSTVGGGAGLAYTLRTFRKRYEKGFAIWDQQQLAKRQLYEDRQQFFADLLEKIKLAPSDTEIHKILLYIANVEATRINKFHLDPWYVNEVYDAALNSVSQSSGSSECKVFALNAGRIRCGSLRPDGLATTYDEAAIRNDISARTAEM